MADQHIRFRSIAVPGAGAEAAAAIVLDTLSGHDDLAVHAVSPGRISVARSHRPVWATVLCACTFWVGGLGLLFLLVRRTDAGEVVVNDGPRGCVVTVPPLLAGATADELERRLRAGEPLPAATDPASTAARAAATAPARADEPTEPRESVRRDDLDDRTIARTAGAPAGSGRGTAPAGPIRLRFDAGTVVVDAGTRLVLGRDPSATAASAVVPGDATTVSKSHLAVVIAPDGSAAVEDLGSTNGSTVRRRDGAPEALAPGVEVPVAVGDVVTLGAVSFEVEDGGTRR